MAIARGLSAEERLIFHGRIAGRRLRQADRIRRPWGGLIHSWLFVHCGASGREIGR
jgi:hypothetical protein